MSHQQGFDSDRDVTSDTFSTPRSILKTGPRMSNSDEIRRVRFQDDEIGSLDDNGTSVDWTDATFQQSLPTQNYPATPPWQQQDQQQSGISNQSPIQQINTPKNNQALQLLTKSLSITLTPAQLQSNQQLALQPEQSFYSDYSGNKQKSSSIQQPDELNNAALRPQDNNIDSNNAIVKQQVDAAVAEALEQDKDNRLQELENWAIRFLNRSLLQRCLKHWLIVVDKRWWKNQLQMKDDQLKVLISKISHVENRPVLYLARQRKHMLLATWREWSARKIKRKHQVARAGHYRKHRLLLKVVEGWKERKKRGDVKRAALYHATCVLGRRRASFVLRYLKFRAAELKANKVKQRHALNKTEVVEKETYLYGWVRATFLVRMRRHVDVTYPITWVKSCLREWRHVCVTKRKNKATVTAALTVSAHRLHIHLFYIWKAVTDGRREKRLTAQLATIQAEHGQMRVEYERMRRVIDSGEWEKERVAQLEAAGEVLQREHDALRDAIIMTSSIHGGTGRKSMYSSSSGVGSGGRQRVSSNNNDGTSAAMYTSPIDATKRASLGYMHNQVVTPPPEKSCSSLDPMTRNKMMVKGGSSFNAMVRALKQDLLKSGAFKRNPEVALEVDKLSAVPSAVSMVNHHHHHHHSHDNSSSDGRIVIEAARPTKAGVVFGRRMDKNNNTTNSNNAGVENKSMGGRSVTIGKRLY
jgi:hypothetical protein